MFLPAISAGYASAARIQQFLLLSEIPGGHRTKKEHDTEKRPLGTLYAIQLAHATMRALDERCIFKDVNLNIRTDRVTMIIGPVGCGKSLVLKSILGEAKLSSGSITMAPGPIAYCDQSPWLQNMSIRDSIIAHSDYNPAWYQSVLHACALEEDLKQLSEGDQASVGAGGCNLSGGQRQRVVCAQ